MHPFAQGTLRELFTRLRPECETLRARYEQDLQRELAHQHPYPPAEALDQHDLDALPTPARKFVVASGVLDHPRASNARIVWRGMQLRATPAASWLHTECEQVSFFREPVRLALMRSALAGLVPFSGYDCYQNGRAQMLVNLAGIVPLRRARGRHMDASALVTYLSEAMLFPMQFADPRLRWTSLGDHSARVMAQHAATSVAGVFTFDPAHEWVRFETEDRWRDGRVPKREGWSAEISGFTWHNGVRVPAEAKASWHAGERSCPYMQGQIESIRYDVTDARALATPHARSPGAPPADG